MSANSVTSTNVMSTIFGNGTVLNTAMTGLIRVPALLAQATAATMAAELTMRALSATIGTFFKNPTQNEYLEKVFKQFNITLRPFKNEEAKPEINSNVQIKEPKWTTKKLALTAVVLTIIGIVANEFVRRLAGPPAPVYNKVLSFMGCIRLSQESYLTDVNNVLKGYGYGFR